LDDKAQTLSYEHYYPYGDTAIIAGKDKTVLLGWLKDLVRVGSLFGFALGG
jgi:hypothetical protein